MRLQDELLYLAENSVQIVVGFAQNEQIESTYSGQCVRQGVVESKVVQLRNCKAEKYKVTQISRGEQQFPEVPAPVPTWQKVVAGVTTFGVQVAADPSLLECGAGTLCMVVGVGLALGAVGDVIIFEQKKKVGQRMRLKPLT